MNNNLVKIKSYEEDGSGYVDVMTVFVPLRRPEWARGARLSVGAQV